jgi:uncharacterized protein
MSRFNAGKPMLGSAIASVLLMSVAAGPAARAETPVRAGWSAPWSAAPSTDIVHEEKTFQNAGVTLSGTLYIPRGRRIVGAVVVAHGASSPLRSSPLYQHLRVMLPPLGMAVFIYDRRGSGKSGGDLKTSDYDLLADDAVAAVKMLKTDRRIDPKRVGVWGLSQGGWLSLLAASRSPDVDFAVSISAPVVTPDLQMIFSSANSLRVNGYPQADIDQMTAARKAVDDYMRGKGDRQTAQRLVDGIKAKPWFKYLYMGDTVSDRAVSRWRKEIEHDPLGTLQSVRAPALVLFGAADPVVPVATSVERLKTVRASHPNLTVAVVAGADHDMQTDVDPKTLLDPNNVDDAKPDSPEYFGLLASWLTRQGFVSGPSAG